MEKSSVDYTPLLASHAEEVQSNTTTSLVLVTKWTIKYLICVIFISWIAFIFLIPAKPVNDLFSKWNSLTSGTPFGITGYLSSIFFFLLCFITVSVVA